jgi:hypothetical protein
MLQIAYEPVWSIGEGGVPAHPEDVEPVAAFIRATLVERFGPAGEPIPVLYGGSVNPENAARFAALPGIGGLFVGRAAWTVEAFAPRSPPDSKGQGPDWLDLSDMSFDLSAKPAPGTKTKESSVADVVSLGIHILDVLGRPVTRIPPRQDVDLIEEIRLTVAGTAAGTSVDLAKLGADVLAMGAIGDDAAGNFIVDTMGRYGIDTSGLRRKGAVQTSASMLPIRPNGERPALHALGANANSSWTTSTMRRSPARGTSTSGAPT